MGYFGEGGGRNDAEGAEQGGGSPENSPCPSEPGEAPLCPPVQGCISIAELRDTNSYSPNPKGAAQYPQSPADQAPAWDSMLDESRS